MYRVYNKKLDLYWRGGFKGWSVNGKVWVKEYFLKNAIIGRFLYGKTPIPLETLKNNLKDYFIVNERNDQMISMYNFILENILETSKVLHQCKNCKAIYHCSDFHFKNICKFCKNEIK